MILKKFARRVHCGEGLGVTTNDDSGLMSINRQPAPLPIQIERLQRISWIFLIVLAMLSACETQPMAPDAEPVDAAVGVVAWVGDLTVTRQQVIDDVSKLSPLFRRQFASAAGRREMLDALVDKRVLEIEARRRELHRDPKIRRQVEQLENRLIVRALIDQEQATPPTDEQLQAYIDAHRAELLEPERFRVARILVAVPEDASPARRGQARRRAHALRERVLQGEPFDEIAADGEGPERRQAGALGWIARGDRDDPALEKAIFSLQHPDSLSEVIECKGGYAVLRLQERREARLPPLSEIRSKVRGKITPTLQRKAFDELVFRLREHTPIRIDFSALDQESP